MTGPVDIALDSEELRWRQWKAKGRADELRFRGRTKRVVIDLAAAIAFGGVIWFAFQF